MPTYEYECEKCSLRFELKRRFSDNGSGFCPRCGSEARRIFSPVPIIFKGPGFYVTDSRKDHECFSDKGDSDKSDGERESEAKKP
jgi:putative FmdB family regulatory protein